MRFVVDFAHERYWSLLERLHEGKGEFKIPEGTYRILRVVVEADGPEDAVARAKADLQWPDREMPLHPMGVTSQADIERALREAEHVPEAPLSASPT